MNADLQETKKINPELRKHLAAIGAKGGSSTFKKRKQSGEWEEHHRKMREGNKRRAEEIRKQKEQN